MRISDWSSDVCSSDLRLLGTPRTQRGAARLRSGQPYVPLCPASAARADPRYRRLQLLDSGLPHDLPDLHPRQLSRGLARAALSRADAPIARALGVDRKSVV